MKVIYREFLALTAQVGIASGTIKLAVEMTANKFGAYIQLQC